MRKIVLLVLACAAVAGCGEVASTPRPPDERLRCEGEPGRPVGSGRVYVDPTGVERHEITDEDNGEYLRSLRAAGQSCRDNVNWLRNYFDGLK